MKEDKFAHVIGLDEVARLLAVPKNTVNQWWNRTKKGEGIRYPMPDPIPNLPVPVWDIDGIVEWAATSNPSRWPASRPEPVIFLAEMGIRAKRPLPSTARIERERPLAGSSATTPDKATISSANRTVPMVAFATAGVSD